MPVFLKENLAVLFIHIPKCGGSSFSRLTGDAGWKEVFSLRGINADKLNMFKCTPQHFHADLLQRTFELEKFDVIVSVVRHPFDRLKSEYYWQRKQAGTKLGPCEWWSRTIADFAANPFVHDNHIRPQHEFLVNSKNLEYFRLEDGGVYKAFAKLPKTSLIASAKQSIRRKPIWEKKSAYEKSIESEFAQIRPDIEAFYEEDMKKFTYSGIEQSF